MSTYTTLLTSVESHKFLMLKSSALCYYADHPCQHNKDRLVSGTTSISIEGSAYPRILSIRLLRSHQKETHGGLSLYLPCNSKASCRGDHALF